MPLNILISSINQTGQGYLEEGQYSDFQAAVKWYLQATIYDNQAVKPL